MWAFDLFYNKNSSSLSTSSCFAIKSVNETDNWDLWQYVGIGIHCLKSEIPKNKMDVNRPVRVFETAGINNNWPGFYIGDNSWIKLDPFELKTYIDINDINWDNKSIVLNRELEKIGIFLYDEIQIKDPRHMTVYI